MDLVYRQLSRYMLPTTIILGTIGALLNQILFYFRKPLRTTSCALYFRALSGNDLIVIWLVMFPQWTSSQFQINPSDQYVWFCKLYTYSTYAFYNLSPYFIVLACFDRLCTSSTNARLRKIATIRAASILIPSMIIFMLLVYIYAPIKSQIVSTSFDSFCAITNPLYNKILAVSLLLLFCLIPPLLMIIFCSITFILLRQQRHRIMPVNQTRLRHRDNQLIKMLFIYVTSNIVCILPFSVIYFIQIYHYYNASPWTDSMVEIFALLTNVAYATSFYVYTLGTPFYRDELVSLLRSIWQRFHRDNNTNNNI